MFRSPFQTLTLLAMVLFLGLQLHRVVQSPAPSSAPAAADSAVQPATTTSATEIYKRVSPSVVAVANHALVRRSFFGLQLYEVPQGSGSGFVWDKKGHIVSNYHVVHKASTLRVTFPDGAQYEAELVGIAPDYDLAVLKVDVPAAKLEAVAVARSRDLEVGETVYAIGNPFGLDTTLSSGIVSALGRTITSMSDRKIYDVIQTDTAINPGNSGGPLLSAQGLLVGVNTAILSPSGAYAGIGFAVPSDTVSRVVPQLIEKGRVTRTGLGVRLLPDHISARTGLKGVAIHAVFEGTPAAEAGLEGIGINRLGALVFGDIIVAVDAHPVDSLEQLQALLDLRRPGERVTIEVARNGRPRKVTLSLVEE